MVVAVSPFSHPASGEQRCILPCSPFSHPDTHLWDFVSVCELCFVKLCDHISSWCKMRLWKISSSRLMMRVILFQTYIGAGNTRRARSGSEMGRPCPRELSLRQGQGKSSLSRTGMGRRYLTRVLRCLLQFPAGLEWTNPKKICLGVVELLLQPTNAIKFPSKKH